MSAVGKLDAAEEEAYPSRDQYLSAKYILTQPGRNLSLFHEHNKKKDGLPETMPVITSLKDFEDNFLAHVTITINFAFNSSIL